MALPIEDSWLERTTVPEEQLTREAQAFLLKRLPPLEIPDTREAWERQAAALRRSLLNTVFLDHVPDAWLPAELKVVWGDTIQHEGYRIRKLRYEAVPGLWIPAVRYEPEHATTPLPAVLNVNGHDYENGKAGEVEQRRGIHLALGGMLALHPEWYSCGELNSEAYRHHNLAYLDAVGVRGVSLFYLAYKRALDVLAADPRTDPARIAMTGLSGGGCQTAFYSALDERVRLIVPVAGYGGMRPRIEDLSDLGDLEQVPSDFLTVADYSHITALFAPRPALLIYNRQDQCCFLPERALPATYDPALPAYRLFGAKSHFQFYINEVPGTHNYEQDNRRRFYRFLNEHFQLERPLSEEEAPCEEELHAKEELYVGLPEDNATFASLAMALLEQQEHSPIPEDGTPAFDTWQQEQRVLLDTVARPRAIEWKTISSERADNNDVRAAFYELTSGDWTLRAAHLIPAGADSHAVTLFIADTGIEKMKSLIDKKLENQKAVLLVDPMFMGTNKPNGAQADKLAMVFESLGVRVLGLQAGQLRGMFDWAERELAIKELTVACDGWNASVAGLMAGALEPGTTRLKNITLLQAPETLKSLITEQVNYTEKPALFCYGLLKHFDLNALMALCRPVPVFRENLVQ